MRNQNLEEIKRIPVIDVALRLNIQVKRCKAMCFKGHDRKTPSLSFKPTLNIWKCFGCGRSGGPLKLVMEVMNCDFKKALEWFSSEYGIGIPGEFSRNRRHRHKPIKQNQNVITPQPIEKTYNEYSADIELQSWLISQCGPVSEEQGKIYLDDHGISMEMAERFSLRELRYPEKAFTAVVERWGDERIYRSGLTWGSTNKPKKLIWPSYAILFPFIENNSVVYIQGRLFQGKRKFVNPTGIPKPLYNIESLKMLPAGKSVHLCEGVPDAIALEGAGLPAVAVMGATSFRKEWVELFLHLNVIVIPDGDEGGAVFLKSVSDSFQLRGKPVGTVKVPVGEDAASIISSMKLRGKIE